jgi:glycosyltransferase involved in cell wall biosynthesis
MPHQFPLKQSFNLAVVCGDGLPISGLLTTLRSAIELVHSNPLCPQVISSPINIDFGFSWRPDKAAFFPNGPQNMVLPDLFRVSKAVPVQYEGYAEDLLEIRKEIATMADKPGSQELEEKIEKVALPYQKYFKQWFQENDVDWVCAINMTLSDSVSVTKALQNAADERWGGGRPGGILFWDHDLFGSYAVHEGSERVYPIAPNNLTPIPKDLPWYEWAVVSDVLEPETRSYPTSRRPNVVTNVLPRIEHKQISLAKLELFSGFLKSINVNPDIISCTPILLCPVRVFYVKGIDLSIRAFAAIRDVYCRLRKPCPYLLIFGDPDEEPEHASVLYELVKAEGVADYVRFLGGVPLYTHIGPTGPRLDERDLLLLCKLSKGGVLYTPKVANVESVGLGPALAAIAEVPCLVTDFNALSTVYGNSLHISTLKNLWQEDFAQSADEFVTFLLDEGPKDDRDKGWASKATENNVIILKTFPERPWMDLLLKLANQAGLSKKVVEEARVAFHEYIR